jgi:hypothetical protein
MAEQKPRAPRARKRTMDADDAAPEASGKRPTQGTKKASTTESAPKRKAAPAPRRRKGAVPTPDQVAVRAYLLWEQGEPGDAAAHWLRAEQELAAA